MVKNREETTNAASCEPKLGIPGNPLPLWQQLPLNAKLPIPTKVPRGKTTYCTTKLGSRVSAGVLYLSSTDGDKYIRLLLISAVYAAFFDTISVI